MEDLEALRDVVRDEIVSLPGFDSWGVEAEIKVYEVTQSQGLFKPSSTVVPQHPKSLEGRSRWGRRDLWRSQIKKDYDQLMSSRLTGLKRFEREV